MSEPAVIEPGWWRRRRLPLIVVAALLPAAIVVSLLIEVPNYLSTHPTQQRDVAAATTAHYADLAIRLQDRRVIRAGSARGLELDVPDGTELVVVTLRIDPAASPKRASLCTVSLVEATAAGDRVWEIGFSSAALFQVPTGDSSSCTTARGAPYTMTGAVLLPAGAAAHAVVRVSVQRALPVALLLH
jgi:hypothetical protein